MFEQLNANNCKCGKEHIFTSKVIVEKSAIDRLPIILKRQILIALL